MSRAGRRSAAPEGRGPAASVARGPAGSGWDAVWGVLVLVAAALAAAAVATVLPVWLPPDFGNADWEFVVAADVAAAVPLLALGLGGLLAAAAAREDDRLSLGVGVGSVAVGLLLLASLLLFATAAPVTLRGAEGAPPTVLPGLQRVVARVLWSQVIGIAGCAAAAVAAFRIHGAARTRSPGRPSAGGAAAARDPRR